MMRLYFHSSVCINGTQFVAGKYYSLDAPMHEAALQSQCAVLEGEPLPARENDAAESNAQRRSRLAAIEASKDADMQQRLAVLARREQQALNDAVKKEMSDQASENLARRMRAIEIELERLETIRTQRLFELATLAASQQPQTMNAGEN